MQIPLAAQVIRLKEVPLGCLVVGRVNSDRNFFAIRAEDEEVSDHPEPAMVILSHWYNEVPILARPRPIVRVMNLGTDWFVTTPLDDTSPSFEPTADTALIRAGTDFYLKLDAGYLNLTSGLVGGNPYPESPIASWSRFELRLREPGATGQTQLIHEWPPRREK